MILAKPHVDKRHCFLINTVFMSGDGKILKKRQKKRKKHKCLMLKVEGLDRHKYKFVRMIMCSIKRNVLLLL